MHRFFFLLIKSCYESFCCSGTHVTQSVHNCTWNGIETCDQWYLTIYPISNWKLIGKLKLSPGPRYSKIVPMPSFIPILAAILSFGVVQPLNIIIFELLLLR